jgi:predicted GNAT superfamily acetyltransferase
VRETKAPEARAGSGEPKAKLSHAELSHAISSHAIPSDAGALTIRKCSSLEEMRACFALQREVWNFSDAELVPVRLFVVVRREYRNAGLGRRLKLFQRDEALGRGIELMEWTFDPLEIKNAYLNIEKLGAIARRYNVNQYGVTSSPLQGGLPSDRLIAEWWMKSERVKTVLAGGRRREFEPETQIDVPAAIYEWKAAAETRPQALAVEERNREQFMKAFAAGLAILGYERNAQGDGRFLLGRWDERWGY